MLFFIYQLNCFNFNNASNKNYFGSKLHEIYEKTHHQTVYSTPLFFHISIVFAVFCIAIEIQASWFCLYPQFHAKGSFVVSGARNLSAWACLLEKNSHSFIIVFSSHEKIEGISLRRSAFLFLSDSLLSRYI